MSCKPSRLSSSPCFIGETPQRASGVSWALGNRLNQRGQTRQQRELHRTRDAQASSRRCGMTVHNPAGAIANPIFLGTNLLMAADELDALVFGMAVDSVRALSVPFAEKVAEVAHRSQGVVLFNLRIDGDMELQRVAAIRYPSNQTGVLVLDRQGPAIAWSMAPSPALSLRWSTGTRCRWLRRPGRVSPARPACSSALYAMPDTSRVAGTEQTFFWGPDAYFLGAVGHTVSHVSTA